MDAISTLMLVIVGLLIGVLVTWLVFRSRVVTQGAAVAQAQVSLQIELAQLRERLLAADQERQNVHEGHDQLKRQAEGWREALDLARDEKAQLSERASRVPVLEAEVARLVDQLRISSDEMLRVSTGEAQKAQSVRSLADQVSLLERENSEFEQRLAEATSELNGSNERRAALEEQATRLPALETKLRATEQQFAEVNNQLTDLREASGRLNSQLAAEVKAERDALALVRNELAHQRVARETAEAEVARVSGELSELRTRLESERENATEKLQLLLQAKEALTDQFKSLANDILEEKSRRFAEQNQVSLGQLLEPLKTRLTEFQGKVEEVYVQEGKDRSALSEQVRQLVELNHALSQDAKNLTLALKGSAKAQGSWGELILERVLEASGLRKGEEYHIQDSRLRDDGTRAQPDVVIDLPEERKLVVDSKVSLVAYERYVSGDSDEDRATAIRQHLDSVRTHVRGLSEKKYQALYGLKSLDFVLMFVPIEPAFMLAVTHDGDLFMDAWQRNVLLVSPSTLLFVVRTVAHLWRQEAQNRNAQEIAKRGADLYDKLYGFVEDLQSVGNRIAQAQNAYEAAHKKLASGRGNVIRQAEMLRDLGVKPSKALPSSLIDASTSDDDVIVVSDAGGLHAVIAAHPLPLETRAPATSVDEQPST